MKKILNFAIYLALISLASVVLAGNVRIYSKINMHGNHWESSIINTQHANSCHVVTEEKIPPSSFLKQFSIRTKDDWACNVILAGGKTICVDSEGWGNIEQWNNVERANCHSTVVARCKGDKMKFDYDQCGLEGP